MTQKEVLDLIYSAHTLDEIEAAERVVEAWLDEHPDDHEVRGTAELLVRTKGALQE